MSAERRLEGSRSTSRGSRRTSSPAEWVLVVGLLAIPMAVLPVDGDLTLVSLWGFLTTATPGGGIGVDGYPVWAYFLAQSRPFATLPPSIRAWPLAIGFHLLAAA
ncbi:TIGR04206 family protein, partial [Halorubrum sp. CBA1125]|nr:TIGR04206 family protein [Halorubrum sp. CBA1125]